MKSHYSHKLPTYQLGHQLNYHYDTVGRLQYVTNETAAEIVHYYYDAVGRLERKNLGNGVYTAYDYDEAGQLTNLTNFKSDDTVKRHEIIKQARKLIGDNDES